MQTARIERAPQTRTLSPAGPRRLSPGQTRTAGIAILVAVIVAVAFLCDGRIDEFVRARLDSPWHPLARFITRYGDWPYLIFYALLFFGAGVLWRNRWWRTLALAMALTCFMTGGTATLIRSVTGRTRPNAVEAQGWYGPRHDAQWTIGHPEFNSFPSGHLGAVAGFVMPLILATRRGRLPGILLGLSMGWARVFSGNHHFSDVVVAALIGVAGGVFAWRHVVPRLSRLTTGSAPRAADGGVRFGSGR